jgi:[ribosomal protein S5]-alanine N-acetyltransferase
MKSGEAVFLQGDALVLTPLGRGDATAAYLAWLNDADVLRYRAPKAYPTTMAQLEIWLDGLGERGDVVLAVRTREDQRHVGNIALNSIQWVHRSAELSIMIGAKDVWGRGYGAEAIKLVMQHAFSAMGMHRLWAESPNPAFNAAIKKLGWIQEGVKREAFLVDGKFSDLICWSILEHEWRAAEG